MYIGRATAGFINPVGAGSEVVGADIVPADGEGFILTSAMQTWSATVGADARLQLLEALDGVTFNPIYSQLIRSAGTLQISDQRALAVSPSGARQAPGSTNLRYRLALTTPGGATNVVSANIVGRTEK